ncbi:HAD-like protein [Punctularia strigosozonata HHB-11173 SS5]|uniref:HAD-like protein n=1 Tax=Punctularia strigosozonata (strain HHB-11173) TaxID=741275 RepID=UPI0004417421|nr:HAD-like protein [Punctularia strigosozonata HHB-11173 SS5]EIN11417.1 HAD-like protein [Punctularia strigosozonata HHB-11173 SS5]
MNPKIEYVLFDMDGLLIDSERVYTDVTNNILAKYGKTMTWDIKAGLMGKPEKEAAAHLLSFFPDISLTIEEYLVERDRQQDLLWPTVQPLPGVVKLVKHLHKHGIPIAVATGSRRRNMVMKTSHLMDAFFGCFGERTLCADDGKIAPGRGKPHPDIFLACAKDILGRPVGEVDQENLAACTEEQREERAKGLVFEDAIPGMQAAKRAGMKVVWVPDANLLGVDYQGVEKADQVLKSLEEFKPDDWGLPPYDS